MMMKKNMICSDIAQFQNTEPKTSESFKVLFRFLNSRTIKEAEFMGKLK